MECTMKLRQIILTAFATALVACGGGKTQSSPPIAYSLMTSQSDVNTGVLTQDKGLGSTGSAYSNFINGATVDFGNKSPTKLEVSSVSLTLGGNSQGVTGLEQVFDAGEVDVLVRIDST